MWYSMSLGKRLDMAASALRNDGSQDAAAAEQVMLHVSGLIERGALRPGDRLASERDLASQVGVSRTSVRAGLRSLAAEGASAEQIATLSDGVTGMYSALHPPQTCLDRDLPFHRAVAAAANNPMLGAIIEAVAALFFEQRRVTIERARNLRESADAHRKIYQAIRARDGESARAAMEEHIRLAQLALATEEGT